MSYTDNESFTGIDFTKDGLPYKEFELCTFVNCNFSGLDLSGINFTECDFDACNLSLCILKKTVLRDLTFKNCKMLGLHFDDCNQFGLSFRFDSCILNMSSFFQCQLSKTVFKNTQFVEADLEECNLSECIFENCDFNKAVFNRTNITGADLSTSINYHIDPEVNQIAGASFSLPDVLSMLNKYGIRIKDP
ncbi:MAG: pentapeptide repeat-containing protein [Flavobacteriales bacterium]|nr:pentapeptide repeat-containing protein [Flavobacteriales bacterium]